MIRVQKLSKSFGEIQAVDAVTLDVEDGESVGILGPSGSGKTTLLRLVAGLELPDQGEISIGGEKVSGPGWAAEPHRRSLGFVFQEPTLWPHMTVEENVLFGLRSLEADEAARRARGLLEEVGLKDLGVRRPHELSLGQARRVAIARALAPRPRRLLMDEPLANLDPELRRDLLGLIGSFVDRTGSSLLYVGHDQEEVEKITARRLRMTSGRLEVLSEGQGQE